MMGLVSSTNLPSSRVLRSNRNNIPVQHSPVLNENISSLNNSSSSPESEAQPAVPRSSPENRRHMDAEIERNSIIPSSHRNTANGDIASIVDLTETQVETPEVLRPQRTCIQGVDDDDEVVIVSSNVPPVIDLCTPGYEETSRRPRTARRRQWSRLVLDQTNQPEGPPVQRRLRPRCLSPSTEAVAYQENEKDDDNAKNNTSDKNNISAHNPFICSVCMDSCLGRRPTTTRCGHMYCEECIKQAIRMTHKCPLCSTKISVKNLIRIYL